MTEYWVSSAKYYCKICNCYMADNRMNRQHHESSARHKMNMDRVNKEKKNQKLNEARSEKELRETLQQIEKAARDAMAADGKEKFAAPPPRTSQPSQRQVFEGSYQRTPKPDQGEPQVPEEEENSGYYTIRDKTYLDGKVFQEKLQDGRRCEIFVEELDDWYPAQITKRVQIKVPNTTIELLSFEVQYTISADDGTEEAAEETNVKTDRLRMIADQELDRDVLDKIEEEKKLNEPPPPPAPIDENTGVSVWQTVSVTVYDEEEAYESHQKAVEEMYSSTKEIDEKVLASTGDNAEFGDVPFYQPKTYKGIVIEDTLVTTDAPVRDDDEEYDGQIVAFKKRKLDETTSVKVEPTSDEAKPAFKPMAKKNFRKK